MSILVGCSAVEKCGAGTSEERIPTHAAHGARGSVIALWLGHESIETTEVYLHASMAMKEKALAKATSSKTRNGRYRPTDHSLAFLKSL